MRRSVTTLLVAVALATPIALASPATAAPVTVTVSCTAGPLSASPSSFSAGIGDVITVSNASGGSFTVGTTTATGNGTLIANSASNTFTVTSGSGGQLVFNPTGGLCTTGAVNFTAGGSNGTSSEDSSAPVPEIQQFGKPASETCEAAAPVSLNWSGVSSGGWSESWAQWMNGGNGGAVCTRTLVYSSAQSRWVVG